jgi:hypothetical protein
VDIGHKAITELAESPAQLSYFWWALSCSGYQVKNGVHIEPTFLRLEESKMGFFRSGQESRIEKTNSCAKPQIVHIQNYL